MRRLLALLLTALLVTFLAGCSDDDGGSSDDAASSDDSVADGGGSAEAEELCATIEGDVVAVLEGDSEEIPDDALAALDDAVAAAPSQIQPDLETVRDTLAEVSELDGSLEDAEAIFDLLLDPEFIGAIEQVGLFLESECDIDIETPSEAGVAEGDGEGDEADAEEDDGLSTDGLRAYVAAEDAAIEDRFQSVATVDGFEISVGVVGLDSGDEAVEICELISGYVYDEVGDAGVTITVNDTSTTTFAEREGEDGTCDAV